MFLVFFQAMPEQGLASEAESSPAGREEEEERRVEPPGIMDGESSQRREGVSRPGGAANMLQRYVGLLWHNNDENGCGKRARGGATGARDRKFSGARGRKFSETKKKD